MASTTTNYGLTKPVYSETADVAAMNTNMDKIDTALGGLDAGIAIVANGNTHAAISEGQYVYIRGHNTLSEGLYKATANIAANGTLSGTNVTSAVMGTALAALSGSTVKYTDVIDNLTSSETSKPLSAKQGKTLSDQIANLSSWTDITSSCTWLNTITVKSCHYNALLKMLMINVQIPSGTANTTNIVTLPSGYTFASTAIIETIGYDNTTNQRIQYGVSSNGKSLVLYTSSGNATGTGAQIYRQFRYV